jgi:OOP family OmpA-OmpF porin
MKKIASILLLSVIATPVFAASNDGFYVGGTLGSGKPGITSAAGLTKNSDFVYGGLLGYQYNRNLAVEAQFTGIGKVTDVAGQTSKGDAFSLSAVGSFPVTRDFDLYGKLGVSSAKTTSSAGFATQGSTRSGLAFGLGGQYGISNNVALRFGWDRYPAATQTAAGVKTNVNANVISVGAVFKF